MEKRCKAQNDAYQENTCKRKTLHKKSPQRKCSKPAGGALSVTAQWRDTPAGERQVLLMRETENDYKLQREQIIVTANMFCPYCGHDLGTTDVPMSCGSCGSSVHFLAEYADGSASDVLTDDLIRRYFNESYSNAEILDFLASKHNVHMSLRSLKRKLNMLSLFRQKNYSTLASVCGAIQEELKGPGQHYGYRSMWQTLRLKYSLTVRRDDVMRVYTSDGPNHVWHVDGYDKLKPYGFGISGCIDGYSRKVLWLKCGASNNDPVVIAQNYMNCLTEYGIIPMRLRTDCGTENGTMAAIQCALRSSHTDDYAGAASHLYGSSMANQRIESWWSYFRKQRSQFWMDLMNDLRERNLFNSSHEHTCLLRFAFMDMLQHDLDECRKKWNTHTIRPAKQSRCPSGKPEVMYSLPHRFGGTDCGFPVSLEELGPFQIEATHSSCGDRHLQSHFEDLQRQSGLMQPMTWETCVELYIRLKNMAEL
ncbi:uncharacterized protein LOC110155161 [Boleophthalmus pectinirostris]|uniref:uncharacterized protein LOC110155161 n=1 Tax=Boleophthalmus pectinirostris TaxID=150288 RepID=UPI002432A70E|nr:uncharacterized protein LOC110155161 [Boleophthalmus pectinirostris]